jgi:hypothetical protein
MPVQILKIIINIIINFNIIDLIPNFEVVI